MLQTQKKSIYTNLVTYKYIVVLCALAVVTCVGAFFVRSLAVNAQTSGVINVVVDNHSGAQVRLSGPRCANSQSLTENIVTVYNDFATFTGCQTGINYTLLNVSYSGRYVDPKGPGHKINQAFHLPAGGNTSIQVFLSPIPATTISVSPTSIVKGSSATLKWTHRNDESCTASGGWSGTKSGSGSISVSPASTTTYTISCGLSSITRSATLTVTNPPPAPAPSTPSSKPSSGSTSKPSSKPSSIPLSAPPVINQNSEDQTPPSMPSGLTADGFENYVLLNWDAADDSEGVTGYIIERSSDGIDWEEVGNGITGVSYTDETVETNTYYFYRVRAVDAAGNQSEAAISEAVLTSSTEEDSEEPEPVAVTENAKGGSSAGAVIGTILVLLLALGGGAVWWIKRRRASQAYYDSDLFLASQAQMPQNPPTQQPSSNDAAPHASMSLKDMVLQDLERNKHDPPSSPPR